jgi:circadian clock protein KaiC
VNEPRDDLLPEKIDTGIPGLDELLEGGIPARRATLITGRSGTCKTVLALQLAAHSARSGRRTLFVSTEERPEDLRKSGDALGFDATELVAKQLLAITDLVHPFSGPLVVSGQFDVSGLVARLAHDITVQGAELLVLDSASALFSPAGARGELRGQFHQLVYGLLLRGVTLVVTAESRGDYDAEPWLGMENVLCDAVIALRNVIDGKRRRRSVEVQKYRRSSHLQGEFPAALTKSGFRVFPLDAQELSPYSPRAHCGERQVSGVVGLDAIAGGGFFRDSVVLVRGPTGSGKTLLAGSVAVTAALRGERVYYMGFEEVDGMLIRNLEAIGLPVMRALDTGRLQVKARYPEGTSPEDVNIELRHLLDEFDPALVVVDSISAIEHVSSFESFRQFIVGITSVLRQRGLRAWLTQASVRGDDSDVRAPYLSTLADAIVELGYGFAGPEMTRSLRILKQRGSAHSLFAQELVLGEQGVQVRALSRGAP